MANLKDLIVNGSARILGTIFGNLVGNVTGNCSGSSGSCTGNANTATTATTANKIKVTDHSANNATYYPVWVTGAGASVDAYNTTSKLKFNPSTGVLTSTSFVGSLTGNVTGNASSATKATQDGSGNTITSTYVNLTGAQTISGAKTFSTNPTISSTGINITGGEPVIQKSGINFIRRTDALILSANNNSIIMRPKGDTNGTNQATLDNTGNLTAVKFTGSLTGNVTGNCSGSSGSCTGNAATATKLGTSTVGSTSQPIYLNSGAATVCNMRYQPINDHSGGTNISGAVSIAMDLTNSIKFVTVTAAVTSIAFTGLSDIAYSTNTFELFVNMGSTAYTVAWLNGTTGTDIEWVEGTAPSFPASTTTLIALRRIRWNTAVKWLGNVQMQWS